MSNPIWSPEKERILNSNIKEFEQYVNNQHNIEFENYEQMRIWSVKNKELFWKDIYDFCKVTPELKSDTICEDNEDIRKVNWFPDTKINFAENLLSRADDKEALVFFNEQNRRFSLTYKQVHTHVKALAGFYKSAGIKQSDRIAAFMPNRPETVTAMLAASSMGAIWSSCSPDFGLQGVIDRFGQIEPKILVATDCYYYSGKRIDTIPRVLEIVENISSIEHVIVVNYEEESGARDKIVNSINYSDITSNQDYLEEELVFNRLPFNHPLYIMYSSGTTGVPKCIVHGAGGTLLQHKKELTLHADLKPEDVIFYFTTCGWMMWNWLVSSLSIGATLVLFDGSPFYPSPKVLFRMIENEKITIFGTSAKFISALDKVKLRPAKHFDLSSLKTILSTGSPLSSVGYDYVYKYINKDVCLSSISGGTDIISCFALGNPCLPVYKGELQCIGLGMDVKIFDDNGQPVKEKAGELVCSSSFPSMPIYFWNDENGEKYTDAYFTYFENTWRHGDWAEITANNGLIIYGRSDATLNPAGVRIGTAEIYRQIEMLEEVADSIVVGQRFKNEERVILFIKPQESINLDEHLIQKIKTHIRTNLTPRHVPAKIIAVPDIPRTISGKIVELAVKKIIHGQEVNNKDALANPECLEYFKNINELNTN